MYIYLQPCIYICMYLGNLAGKDGGLIFYKIKNSYVCRHKPT